MQTTILCYHKVGLVAEEGRRLNIEPLRLRSHVRFFSRRGYRIVRAVDLLGPWKSRSVCFTFDDAYQSTLENAPSILEECGGVGSFYAVPTCVGDFSSWDGEQSRPLANWDLLREVQRRGHEIGNHTYRHSDLTTLDSESQREEIRLAHLQLTAESIESKTFCYPYGRVNSEAVEQLRACDYRLGLGLGKRLANDADDRLNLPRVILAYSDAIPMLLYKTTVKSWMKTKKANQK